MSESDPAERTYGAGEDIPGTPGPFPFGTLSLGAALIALSAGICAMVLLPPGWDPEPFFMTMVGIWAFFALDWLILGALALWRGQARLFGLGLIAVLAPPVILVFTLAAGIANF